MGLETAVSIPFSSGRRRLHIKEYLLDNPNTPFQSPSHRGGGASEATRQVTHSPEETVSIPFSSGRRRLQLVHFADVVPSMLTLFQSPSHRGGGASDAI